MVSSGHPGGMSFELPAVGTACEQCGLPRPESVDILSRHRTSRGLIVYTRCICGLLEAWLCRPEGSKPMLVAQGGRHVEPLRTTV